MGEGCEGRAPNGQRAWGSGIARTLHGYRLRPTKARPRRPHADRWQRAGAARQAQTATMAFFTTYGDFIGVRAVRGGSARRARASAKQLASHHRTTAAAATAPSRARTRRCRRATSPMSRTRAACATRAPRSACSPPASVRRLCSVRRRGGALLTRRTRRPSGARGRSGHGDERGGHGRGALHVHLPREPEGVARPPRARLPVRHDRAGNALPDARLRWHQLRHARHCRTDGPCRASPACWVRRQRGFAGGPHEMRLSAPRQVLSSVFIACMNTAYTSLLGVGLIGALLHRTAARPGQS